mmetsp:Transcript_20516/g.44463  ORF Transcript_20516/g.44463 Transcript_20516/m.44463 type:complete len:228 (+) Transcript_20516:509-1192(+)
MEILWKKPHEVHGIFLLHPMMNLPLFDNNIIFLQCLIIIIITKHIHHFAQLQNLLDNLPLLHTPQCLFPDRIPNDILRHANALVNLMRAKSLDKYPRRTELGFVRVHDLVEDGVGEFEESAWIGHGAADGELSHVTATAAFVIVVVDGGRRRRKHVLAIVHGDYLKMRLGQEENIGYHVGPSGCFAVRVNSRVFFETLFEEGHCILNHAVGITSGRKRARNNRSEPD